MTAASTLDPPEPALVAKRQEPLQLAEEEYVRIPAAIAAQGDQYSPGNVW